MSREDFPTNQNSPEKNDINKDISNLQNKVNKIDEF